MKRFLILLFIVKSSLAFAQQDTTTIFSNPGYNKDPLRAKWEKVIERKDSLWVVSLYDKKKVLREKISFADINLEVRKGPYAFYENGNVKEEGNYNRGYKVGDWNYYNENHQLLEKVRYVWGKLDGNYSSYWENGSVKKEGTYATGKKVGDWKVFYKDKKPALTEEYDAQGKLVDGIYFDEQGKSVSSLYIIQPPSYPGGIKAFYEFLGREIKYPANAAKNMIQGTVRLEFVVAKDGRVEDIKVKESPDEELTREAVRVLQYSRDWIPAKELGEYVRVRYTVPIRFALNR